MDINKEDLKKFVESLVRGLREKGVDVRGGALMKLKDNGEVESINGFGTFNPNNPNSRQDLSSLLPPEYINRVKNMSREEFETERNKVREDLKFLIGKLTEKIKESKQVVNEAQEEVDGESCTCSSCLNYDNFEEKLKTKGGDFDYAQITLGKKLFKLKYHVSESGEENITMRDITNDIDINNLSPEQLQEELQKAVRDKRFDKAQVLLNAIQELKNKN